MNIKTCSSVKLLRYSIRTKRLIISLVTVLLIFSNLSAAYAATFTASMAKRDGPGPFAVGVISQGNLDSSSILDDQIRVTSSSIATGFESAWDGNQGSIVLWLTPEWNGNDGKNHQIWGMQGYQWVLRKKSDGNLAFNKGFSGGGDLVTVDASSWTAGTTYNIVVRWDIDNTLDGTNYASISINDNHTFSRSSSIPATSLTSSVFDIGLDANTCCGLPNASALIEGLTIYRRPLFDGTYGIDVGNGDEINQIYNSGTGKDPTLVTGSWDVVFALPTNSSTGALTTGTGNAWTHPHASNLLYTSTTNTGGFMMNGTYTSDSWSIEGLNPLITVEALATSEKIYAGGYKTTSDGLLANEGIYYDKTVVAGNDWVIRALAHSDGTSIPKVILYDQTNGAEIGSLTGTSTSTRTDPDVFIFTGEAPAGMTTLRVKLVNTQSSGTTYWHQVEVYSNSAGNPSFEAGSGDPWIPTGWVNGNGIDAGESIQSGDAHSGTSSFELVGASQIENIGYTNSLGTSGQFNGVGAFTKKVSSNYAVRIGDYNVENRFPYQHTTSTSVNLGTTNTDWTHVTAVGRVGTTLPFNRRLAINAAQFFSTFARVDDIYSILLSDVSLTVTPASEANSTENTDEVRVDGRDTYVASSGEAVSIYDTRGYMSFNYRPRHSAADSVKFAETTSDDAYILGLAGDSNDFIKVYWDSANTLKMEYSMNGTTASSTWTATGLIDADTEYNVVVAYTGGGTMTLSVGGTNRITLSSIPSAFGTAPNTVYFGSDTTGANQGDATFSNFVFDNTAPSILLTALSPDPNTDNTPSLTGTASDTETALTDIEFQVDSTLGSWTNCTASDGAIDELSEAYTCTTPSLTDGTHTIYIRATDSAFNTTALAGFGTDTFTIDATIPTTPGTPSTDTPSSDNTPTWEWEPSVDTLSGLDTQGYEIQWCMDSTYSGCSLNTGNTTQASYTHSETLTDGVWYLRVSVSDTAGNTSNYSTSGSVVIDTKDPSPDGFEAMSPKDKVEVNSSRPVFKFRRANDETSGINKYEILIRKLNDEWNNQEGEEEYTLIKDIDDRNSNETLRGDEKKVIYDSEYIKVQSQNDGLKLTDGKYTWRVRAVDEAGNDVHSNSQEFEVKTTLTSDLSSLITDSVLNLLPDDEEPTDVPDEIKDLEANKPKENEESADTKTYAVSIRVIDEDNNPVKGAKVTIHSTPRTTYSDQFGMAEFDNIEAGKHRIEIVYANQVGEQELELKGDTAETINIEVKLKAISPFLSTPVLILVSTLLLVIALLVRMVLKRR